MQVIEECLDQYVIFDNWSSEQKGCGDDPVIYEMEIGIYSVFH